MTMKNLLKWRGKVEKILFQVTLIHNTLYQDDDDHEEESIHNNKWLGLDTMYVEANLCYLLLVQRKCRHKSILFEFTPTLQYFEK